MNPEMNDSVLGLALFAILAWVALGWTVKGGPSRVIARLQSRRGGKR